MIFKRDVWSFTTTPLTALALLSGASTTDSAVPGLHVMTPMVQSLAGEATRSSGVTWSRASTVIMWITRLTGAGIWASESINVNEDAELRRRLWRKDQIGAVGFRSQTAGRCKGLQTKWCASEVGYENQFFFIWTLANPLLSFEKAAAPPFSAYSNSIYVDRMDTY